MSMLPRSSFACFWRPLCLWGALFLAAMTLQACGKRPTDVDAPLSLEQKGERDAFPRLYPQQLSPLEAFPKVLPEAESLDQDAPPPSFNDSFMEFSRE